MYLRVQFKPPFTTAAICDMSEVDGVDLPFHFSLLCWKIVSHKRFLFLLLEQFHLVNFVENKCLKVQKGGSKEA